MRVALVIFVLVGLLSCTFVRSEPARFDNYRIYEVEIGSEEQLVMLKKLSSSSNDYELLEQPRFLGQKIGVIVAPVFHHEFVEICNNVTMQPDLQVENLQTLIDKETVQSRVENYGWDSYFRLNDIYAWMNTLVSFYPGVVTKIVGGRTYEGREIQGVLLSKNPSNPGIFIEANIHAREWITSASTTWIINELLTSTDPEVMALLNNYNWYIFPVVNPDGFEYTHTQYRLWRKTRSRQGVICWGVDPNRNWDIFWQAGGNGASADICSNTFAGSKAFSEIETQTLSEYITSIKDKLKLYISFHSAARMLLFPWGHTHDLSPNHQDLMTIATEAYKRLNAVYGTVYTFGPVISTICKKLTLVSQLIFTGFVGF